jgi:hypothetical protein
MNSVIYYNGMAFWEEWGGLSVFLWKNIGYEVLKEVW